MQSLEMTAGVVASPFKTVDSCRRLLAAEQYRIQLVSFLLAATILVFAYDTDLLLTLAAG